MKSFELKRVTETIDISGEKFEIDTAFSKVKESILMGHKLEKEIKKLQDTPDDASAEDKLKAIEGIENPLKEAFEFVLGEGSYERLYPKANKSILVMADVLFQVIDYTNEKQQAEQEKRVAKYTKKKR